MRKRMYGKGPDEYPKGQSANHSWDNDEEGMDEFRIFMAVCNGPRHA